MKFNENGKKEVFSIDIDGTLTNNEKFWEEVPTVKEYIRKWVKEKYEEGNIIIIHTARAWEHAPETVGWLIANRIPFHGIQMSKGGADYYLDDKVIKIDELK